MREDARLSEKVQPGAARSGMAGSHWVLVAARDAGVHDHFAGQHWRTQSRQETTPPAPKHIARA